MMNYKHQATGSTLNNYNKQTYCKEKESTKYLQRGEGVVTQRFLLSSAVIL